MSDTASTTPANPGRRRSIQAGLAGTAAALASTRVATPVHAKDLPRPPWTAPFMVELPACVIKETVDALTPVPTGTNDVVGEAGRDPHVYWADFPPRKFYKLDVKPGEHWLHPHLPKQTIWGYDGMFPGPTFVERYGVPVLVRIYNKLPWNSPGPGSPEISTHLHNLHCASASDGFPGDYYSETQYGPTIERPGAFRDHHYPNRYAGFRDPRYAPEGDSSEALGTLWYHDHCLHSTGGNVYRGLAGFYLLFDDVDNGDENDKESPTALRLPSGVGKYDIPMVFNDPRIDSSGYMVFDKFENDGHLGNVFCVNGKIQPYFKVERRKYRLRMLCGSIARVYEFYLTDKNGVNQGFTYIANDGNLLPSPLFNQRKVALAPAERADIVIDFAKYPLGTQLYLVNRLIQKDGRGPDGPLVNVRGSDGLLVAPGLQVMRFDIDKEPPETDVSQVPGSLRPLPSMNLRDVAKERTWKFDRENDVWTVNGKQFDEKVPVVKVKRDSAEIWRLQVKGNWTHPIHIHLEEFRILSRNGKLPQPHERGRKDVMALSSGEEARIFIQFRDFQGKYVMHCHNLTHEDHNMMVFFEVVD
jgi:FtsP/CotA-like multicopper oxidase with cupredoxin domain